MLRHVDGLFQRDASCGTRALIFSMRLRQDVPMPVGVGQRMATLQMILHDDFQVFDCVAPTSFDNNQRVCICGLLWRGSSHAIALRIVTSLVFFMLKRVGRTHALVLFNN